MADKPDKIPAFQLTIEKYVPPGDGLGFFDGKAVFVPGTSVGDVVTVVPKKVKKQFIIAALQDVLIPSPDRIEAPCPHYEACGGCSLMHLPYTKQLKVKQEALVDHFDRVSLKIKPLIIPSPKTTRFRFRTHLKLQNRIIGFSERRGTSLVDISGCLILSQGIHDLLPKLNQLGRSDCEFLALASSFSDGLSVAVIDARLPENLPGYPESIIEDYGFGELELRGDGFAQSNPFITRVIIEDVLRFTNGSKEILELYCGSGTFSIPLAKTVERLTGIDSNKNAIALAEQNAIRHGVLNTEFQIQNLEKVTPLPVADTVVVDPPRKGLSRNSLHHIGQSKTSKLVYVSCDPATQARDIKTLVTDYDFCLSSLNGYDMYCHSTHLETLAVLSR